MCRSVPPRFCASSSDLWNLLHVEEYASRHALKIPLKSPHISGLFCPYSRSLLTLVWSAQARGVIEVKGKGEMKTYWVSESGSTTSPNGSRSQLTRNFLNTVLEDGNSEDRQALTEVAASEGFEGTMNTVPEGLVGTMNTEVGAAAGLSLARARARGSKA